MKMLVIVEKYNKVIRTKKLYCLVFVYKIIIQINTVKTGMLDSSSACKTGFFLSIVTNKVCIGIK